MTPEELVDVLEHAAHLDARFTFDVDTVRAWHPLLAKITKDAALAAVDAHYARTPARLMPADIVRAAAPRSREQWLRG